jgi:hypothetical protein
MKPEDAPTVIAVLTQSICGHSRGDPTALARNILLDLFNAGFDISKASEDAGSGRRLREVEHPFVPYR